MNKTSLVNKTVDTTIIVFFVLVSISMVFPFLNVLCLSLEPEHIAIEPGVIHLIPRQITLKAYEYIFQDDKMLSSFLNSTVITVAGAAGGVIFSGMLAYGLASEKLYGRKLFSFIVLWSMVFKGGGGIIPTYMLVKGLGLIDTLWALIIPTLLGGYYVLLMRVFFKELPKEMSESAMMDGCTEMGVFFKIVLPLSTPIIATITLFYAVRKWNSFMDGVMFILDEYKKPLQVVLREMLIVADGEDTDGQLELGKNIKMATTIFTVVPILCVYPFLQKHFAKGILLGAVKG